MADTIANIPPPSASIINLVIADLCIYSTLLPLALWVTWKHGKAGMVCWPIFLSYFGLRLASDAYQIVHRHDPNIPNTVAIMTNAGSIACISLCLLGIVYEANLILALAPRRWTVNLILGATHVFNTGGIALATYGGAPSATAPGGVASQSLDQIGNCLMLFVMFSLCWWMWPTYKRIKAATTLPSFKAARYMLLSACVGIPFQLVRLGYNTTYSFVHSPFLDPIMGTFAVRLLLIFFPQLGATLALLAGGWLGMHRKPAHNAGPGLGVIDRPNDLYLASDVALTPVSVRK